jgi:hypothetical protein
MNKDTFDDYISRFNACDATAFDDYLTPDVTVQNGRLCYEGVDGMKAHYAHIWRNMKETLSVLQFVSDGDVGSVEMKTHFEVLADAMDSPFGVVKAGQSFDYHGVIMYQFQAGKIKDIKVSYLDFVRTDVDGEKTSLGIVH